MSNQVQEAKMIVDVAAGAGVVATIMGWLPAIAAVLGIVWYLVQLFESKTGQRIIEWARVKIFRRPPSA